MKKTARDSLLNFITGLVALSVIILAGYVGVVAIESVFFEKIKCKNITLVITHNEETSIKDFHLCEDDGGAYGVVDFDKDFLTITTFFK
jgi:hypothetical protein